MRMRNDVPSAYTDKITANIRAQRAYKAIKQDEVVEGMHALGYTYWHRQTVGQVEHGKRHLLAAELFGLAQVLGTSVNRLLGIR